MTHEDAGFWSLIDTISRCEFCRSSNAIVGRPTVALNRALTISMIEERARGVNASASSDSHVGTNGCQLVSQGRRLVPLLDAGKAAVLRLVDVFAGIFEDF